MSSRSLLLSLPLLLTAACAGSRAPLKPTEVEIAGGRATFRDYRNAPGRLCEAEHRWLLDELVAVNSVLRRFADRVGTGELGRRERALLEEGAQRLPAVLDSQAFSLREVARCSFASRGGFTAVTTTGKEYIREVRALLEEAPQRIARAEAMEQLRAWRANLPRAQMEAQTGCDRKNQRRIYFAWEQENGTRNFAFCDGASVTQRDGDKPLWLPPEGAPTRGRRAPKERDYLQAVKGYAVELISRPPRVPEITAARASSTTP